MGSASEQTGGLTSRLDELINEVVSEETDETASPAVSAPQADLSGLLGGLAANGEWLTMLPQLMKTVGPLLGGLGGHGGGFGKGLHLDRHTALLCAIKPYLCAERQKAADQLIGLCKMGDALQKLPLPHSTVGGDGHV
jgi:hypothetical protein